MITVSEFKKAKEVINSIISVCRDVKHEDSFKRNVLGNLWWEPKKYKIERIHMSGSTFRITIVFDDGSTYDMYRDADFVFEWYGEEFNKLKGEVQ